MKDRLKDRLKGVLTLMILLVSFSVSADDRIYLGAWSKHISSTDVNEKHDLIGIESNGIIGGQFINSFNRQSYFLGAVLKDSYHSVEYGVILGAVHGYSICYGENGRDSRLCPLFVPYVTYNSLTIKPVLLLMGDAVTLSFAIDI